MQPRSQNAMGALSTERLHAVLRCISDDDWRQVKALLGAVLLSPEKDQELDLLERLLRKGEALARQAGGIVLRLTQTIVSDPAILDTVRQANERRRAALRFVLREMSPEDWARFKGLLSPHLAEATREDELGVLELVLRIGESVSNVEVAATAKHQRDSGNKLIAPEVARHNALVKAHHPTAGTAPPDPEAAYAKARRDLEEAEQTARRARHTLACCLVKATAPYRHARNTLFHLLDTILETGELMAFLAPVEQELSAIPPLERERLRWALHRLPLERRLAIIQAIPLNNILVFQENETAPEESDAQFRASRDRRLAEDLFVRGLSDEALAQSYGLSVNGAKNAVGTLLDTLRAKPLVRKEIHAFLARMDAIPPLSLEEVRKRMKQLTPEQRAEVLAGIPNRAWKVQEIIPLHKHLFLDYQTGEWVLATLVRYYNLDTDNRLAGVFKCDGTLTLRGANAAITGILQKIAEEPLLREYLLSH
jgi:hypothetical protein